MGYKEWCILGLTLLTWSGQSKAQNLPNHSRPLHYDLEFTFPSTKFQEFEGKAKIRLEVLEPTKQLTLHSARLNIEHNKTQLISLDNNSSLTVAELRNSSEYLDLVFSEELPLGKYELYLEFSGSSHDRFKWFLFSGTEYVMDVNSKNMTREARRFFPCWDEDKFESTFNLILKCAESSVVVKEKPLFWKAHDLTIIDGRKWSYLETRSEIKVIEILFRVSNHWVNLRAYRPQYVKNEIGFRILSKTVSMMENLTSIPYPFPKTYRYEILREYEELNNSTLRWRVNIIKNIIHRITSQWFLNIIGPAESSNLWEMKGLHKYFDDLILAEVFDTKLMKFFLVMNRDLFFNNVDQGSFPNEAPHPSVDNVKAELMIHMLSGFVSQKVFQTYIRKLFQQNDYSKNIRERFWELMEEAKNETDNARIHFDLKEMMDSYAKLKGYPILKVARNYTTGIIKLTQEIFWFGENESHVGEPLQYRIPISLVTNSSLNFSSTLPTYWMNPNEELVIEGVDRNDWFILNIQKTGDYSVNYDEENWKRIAEYLNSTEYSKIQIFNRAAILGDASMLYETKRLNKDLFVKLISYLTHEVDYIPWLHGMKIIYNLLTSKNPAANLDFTKELVDTLLNILGLDQGYDIPKIFSENKNDLKSTMQLMADTLHAYFTHIQRPKTEEPSTSLSF